MSKETKWCQGEHFSLFSKIMSKIHALSAEHSNKCYHFMRPILISKAQCANHCLKNGIMQSGSVIASKLLKLDLGAFGGEAKGVDNKVIKTFCWIPSIVRNCRATDLQPDPRIR